MSQLVFDLQFRPALGRDKFFVSDSNRDAVAWLDRWPDWPGHALAIHGPAGCGKTHLAHVWQSQSQAEFLTGIDAGSLAPGMAVILDECLGGAAGADMADRQQQVALFHFLNRLRELKGSLLLLHREAPARWPIALPDLASRLAAIPAIAVAAPDDALLGAILIKHFADRRQTVGDEVIDFLVRHIERSFTVAAKTVAAIDLAALAHHRRITLPLVRHVVGRLERDRL